MESLIKKISIELDKVEKKVDQLYFKWNATCNEKNDFQGCYKALKKLNEQEKIKSILNNTLNSLKGIQ